MAKPKKLKCGEYSVRFSYMKNGLSQNEYKSGFKTYQDAKEYEKQFRKGSENHDNFKLHDFIDFVIKIRKGETNSKGECKYSKNTLDDNKYYFDKIKKTFGNLPLDKIKPYMLQEYLTMFNKTPTNKKHISEHLSIIFKNAYLYEILERNPYDRVKKPPKPMPNTFSFLTSEGLNKWLKGVKEVSKYIYPVVLLCSLNLRPSEAMAIKEKDIHKTETGYVLTINKAFETVRGSRKGLKDPKTEKSNRLIFLTEELYNEILSVKRKHDFKSDYICLNSKGKLLSYDHVRKEIVRVRKVKEYKEQITLYSLRRSFSNLAKKQGFDDYTISDDMGNSPEVLRKYYFKRDLSMNENVQTSVQSLIKFN